MLHTHNRKHFTNKDIDMQTAITLNCPQEILLGLHLNAEQFTQTIKLHAAIALFREGKITSGMAARWLEMPRVHFLLKAMQDGQAQLLQDDQDDLARETSLL